MAGLQRINASTPVSVAMPSDVVKLLELSIYADNEREGTLTGCDCRICHNKGYVSQLRGTERVTVECECMPKRRSLRLISESGLGGLLSECTLDAFQTLEDWQRRMKATVKMFLEQSGRSWLAILGQTGCGKTHLCTAVCGELLERGVPVRYLSWISFVRTMERLRFRDEQRDEYYKPVEQAQVLYLDDFLKRETGDFALATAFDLIDYREKAGLVTILSGERRVDEIATLDAALASRIKRACGKFCIELKDDAGRNWRMKS